MDFLKKLEKENNIDILYECVAYLEETRDYPTLDTMFKKYLVGSCDIRVWRIYLKYVTGVKKLRDREIYEFVIKNIGYHWESTDIYQEYISVLLRGEDTSDKLDNIRGLYMRMLHIPIANLMEVYNSYEEFENEFNKLNARRILAEITPLYQNSFKTYNNTIGFINNPSIENCARLIDIEKQNPLCLDEKNLLERLDFIYRYFVAGFYKNEEPVYFYVEHLSSISRFDRAREVLEASFMNTTSLFLKISYAKLIGEQRMGLEETGENPGKAFFLEMLSTEYDDVVAVSLLNFTLKKEGLEAFRRMFIKLKLNYQIGPTVFRYVAETEFYIGNNKKTAYDIFAMGIDQFPESNLHEHFLNLLLFVGDEENAKALFKKSPKTSKMWNTMIQYEYLYGGDVQYKELINERVNLSTPVEKNEVGDLQKYTGILLKYKLERKSCSFGLFMDHPKFIYDFIFSLPYVNFKDDILCSVDLATIQEIMKEAKL